MNFLIPGMAFFYRGFQDGSVPAEANGFWASRGTDFHQIAPTTFDESHLTGWKMHLSVSAEDAGRAWDIVHQAAMRMGIPAKVVTPEVAQKFSDAANHQAGKMITLYDTKDVPPETWQKFVSGVEERFKKAGIQPSHPVQGDVRVPGSQYSFYSNDRDEHGNYIDARDRITPKEGKFSKLNVQSIEEKLNDASKAVAQRTGAQWEMNEGSGATGVRNARITLSNPLEADALAKKLQESGIPAQFAEKGDKYLVMVKESDFAAVTAEAAQKTAKALAPEAADIAKALGTVAKEAEPAAGALAKAGKGIGILGKVLGPFGKILGAAAVGAVVLEANSKAEAAEHDGTMTREQADAYKKTAMVGAALDAAIPIPVNGGANAVRDTLLEQGLSPEARAKLQIGNPDSQLGRVRDGLPNRAEGNVSPDMKKFIDLNANIKTLEAQEGADPTLRQKVAGMEMDLFKQFDGMRADPAKRAEFQKLSGVPIDAAETTYVAPPAATVATPSPSPMQAMLSGVDMKAARDAVKVDPQPRDSSQSVVPGTTPPAEKAAVGAHR